MSTAYDLLELVRARYSGAQEHFVISRLQLRSGLSLRDLLEGDRDRAKARRLLEAIEDICPDILT
ncbi:MAG: hypothetical protein OEY14_11245 [Myxococcales bacterium]|nr:hypothetical protein [Myxococcales bacterium]